MYLNLAWAVAQASSLAGSEHVDHLIQTSLQGTEHLPTPLLFAAVSCCSHVQGPRPKEQIVSDLDSSGEITYLTSSWMKFLHFSNVNLS